MSIRGEEAFKNISEFTGFERIQNYIQERYKKDEYSETLSTWDDYLRMCKKLELDTHFPKILFPDNLYGEHDRLVGMIKEQEDRDITDKIKKRYIELNEKYAFEDEAFKIVVPESYSDIAGEARCLKNCLISSGYYKRHANENITILFLRKAAIPDKSYFCLTIDKNEEISQIEGYQEKYYAGSSRIRPGKAEITFLEKWKQEKCKLQQIPAYTRAA